MASGQSGYLSEYQSSWKNDFDDEKRRLLAISGSTALDIEHIGSTSVEGLASKPIIDLSVMIESQKDTGRFTEPLAGIEYRFEPPIHLGIPERHFYKKGDPVKYQLSIAYTDVGGFWPRQILFRDYLRSNPDARAEYTKLKEEMLSRDPPGRRVYHGGKTEFVYRILRLRRPRVFLDTPLTYSRSERRVTMGKVTRGSVGAERARASGAPTDPSTTSRGRFSVQKKTAAVLRMMRGESLDIVSRDLGVTAGRLSEWRDQFHAGAQAALRARPSDDRDEKVKDLQAKVGELTMDNELLQQKIERLEARRPLMHRRSQK